MTHVGGMTLELPDCSQSVPAAGDEAENRREVRAPTSPERSTLDHAGNALARNSPQRVSAALLPLKEREGTLHT